MKKVISLFMILNIVLVVFSITDLQAVSAAVGCCVSNNQCSFIDKSQCSGSFIPGSCSSVSQCQSVCCITQEGQCYSDKSRIDCNSLQGYSYTGNSKCSGVEQCEKICCILGNDVQFGITKSECNNKAGLLGVTPDIRTGISSLSACRALISNQEGCCITAGGCSRTYTSQCSGDFKGGTLCSAPELSGKCACNKEDSQSCDGGNVVWEDSCGNLENVVGVPYDGRIHNDLSDIQGKQGYCDISKNKMCGKITGNKYDCVDLNCDVGDVFPLYEDYDPELGIFENKNDITITKEMLGLVGVQQFSAGKDKGSLGIEYYSPIGQNYNKENRVNGESWCMPVKMNIATEETMSLLKNSQDYQNKDDMRGALPGDSHYVYTCINGRIEVESCGILRDTICDETLDDEGISYAGCRDNEWENCFKTGKSASNCYGRGDCRFDSSGRNECWPNFPPGFEFWDETKVDESNQQCDSECGKGKLNKCDKNECEHCGDCQYEGGWTAHWSTKNALIGAAIGAGVGAVVTYPTAIGGAIKGMFTFGGGGKLATDTAAIKATATAGKFSVGKWVAAGATTYALDYATGKVPKDLQPFVKEGIKQFNVVGVRGTNKAIIKAGNKFFEVDGEGNSKEIWKEGQPGQTNVIEEEYEEQLG